MSKYIKRIIQVFLLYLLIIIQITFISSLNFPLYLINLPLLLLSTVVIIDRTNIYIYLALIIGFIFDVYTFSAFSVYMFSFVITAIISRFLQISYFTNRSVYSFIAITIFITLIFNFSYHIFNYIFNIYNLTEGFFLSQSYFWQALGYKIIFHSVIITILFYIINFSTRRMKPYILEKK